jgi:two-component system, OmpR family, alkaline phosphatase synthesis response regulator PhoP
MQNKPSVLIIDDENDIIEILTFILNRNGMEVFSAPDGKAALHLLNTRKFSGIVSDLVMPNIDGLELLKIVRSQGNTVPFIFLSGNASSVHEHEMINYGAYELIHKPELERVPDALKKLFKTDFEVKKLEDGSIESREFLDLLHDINKAS